MVSMGRSFLPAGGPSSFCAPGLLFLLTSSHAGLCKKPAVVTPFDGADAPGDEDDETAANDAAYADKPLQEKGQKDPGEGNLQPSHGEDGQKDPGEGNLQPSHGEEPKDTITFYTTPNHRPHADWKSRHEGQQRQLQSFYGINADDAGCLLPMKSGEINYCLQPSLIEGEGLLPTDSHPIFTLHPLPARVMMGILSPVALIRCASSLPAVATQPECQPASLNACGLLQLCDDIEGNHANLRVNPKVKMKPMLLDHIMSPSNVNLAKLDEVARISGFHFLIPLRGSTSDQWNDEATNEDAVALKTKTTRRRMEMRLSYVMKDLLDPG